MVLKLMTPRESILNSITLPIDLAKIILVLFQSLADTLQYSILKNEHVVTKCTMQLVVLIN